MKVVRVFLCVVFSGAWNLQALLAEDADRAAAGGSQYQDLSTIVEDIGIRNRDCQIVLSGNLLEGELAAMMSAGQRISNPSVVASRRAVPDEASPVRCTAENSTVQCEPDEWFRARSLAGVCRRDRCTVLLPQSACDLLGITPGPVDPLECPDTINNHPDAQLLNCVWQHECSHLRSHPQTASCDSELEAFSVQLRCLRDLHSRFCDQNPVHPLWTDSCTELDRHRCNAALGEYVNQCVCASANVYQCRTNCGDQCPAPVAQVPECARFSAGADGGQAGQACANLVTDYCAQQFQSSPTPSAPMLPAAE